MRKFFRLLCLALCGLCLLLPSALSESLPPCQGVVTDLAGVLSTDTAAGLEALAQRMEAAGCGRLYVVTRHFLGGKDARAYADRLFAAWGLQDKDGLLLLAVGEETYALSLGSAAQAALPQESRTALLAQKLRADYLARDYDAAAAAFALGYAGQVSRALGARVDTAGVLGQESQPQQQNAWSLSDWRELVQPEEASAQDWAQEQRQTEKKTNWRAIIIWALVIYFLFFRKKSKKMKKKNAFNFGHRPGRRW